jgi:hypothetical protein
MQECEKCGGSGAIAYDFSPHEDGAILCDCEIGRLLKETSELTSSPTEVVANESDE